MCLYKKEIFDDDTRYQQYLEKLAANKKKIIDDIKENNLCGFPDDVFTVITKNEYLKITANEIN